MMAAHSYGLELVKEHKVKIPEKLTVHSISGIFCNNNFILAYYAGELPYAHGGVAKSKQCIFITRGTPDNWQDPFIVATPDDVGMPDCACFDPVLYQVDGKIYLFYRIGHSPRDWHGFVKISYDNGVQWSSRKYFGPRQMQTMGL
jgi:hypothetical protein